jgi:hypothetical protein
MLRKRTSQEATAARRLQELGIPLEFDENQCRSVLIRQHGSQFENCAYELGCGATAYVLNVSVTSRLSNLCMPYVYLTVPWPDRFFYWLEDPAETDGKVANYRIPGFDVWYERNMVVNHRFGLRQPLRRGSSIQGLLLGFGGPIPAEFKQGMTVPVRLIVVDQFEEEYHQELELWIDRTEGLARQMSRKPKRKPIFGVHDELYEDSPTTSTESGRTNDRHSRTNAHRALRARHVNPPHMSDCIGIWSEKTLEKDRRICTGQTHNSGK